MFFELTILNSIYFTIYNYSEDLFNVINCYKFNLISKFNCVYNYFFAWPQLFLYLRIINYSYLYYFNLLIDFKFYKYILCSWQGNYSDTNFLNLILSFEIILINIDYIYNLIGLYFIDYIYIYYNFYFNKNINSIYSFLLNTIWTILLGIFLLSYIYNYPLFLGITILRNFCTKMYTLLNKYKLSLLVSIYVVFLIICFLTSCLISTEFFDFFFDIYFLFLIIFFLYMHIHICFLFSNNMLLFLEGTSDFKKCFKIVITDIYNIALLFFRITILLLRYYFYDLLDDLHFSLFHLLNYEDIYIPIIVKYILLDIYKYTGIIIQQFVDIFLNVYIFTSYFYYVFMYIYEFILRYIICNVLFYLIVIDTKGQFYFFIESLFNK